mmetsp:Transcript_112254/g.194921  ORF Transcript_112254/g.194921 Transcript_112254/m.194921 type:complete len:819 (-) Transcript_112254:602-3058(-)
MVLVRLRLGGGGGLGRALEGARGLAGADIEEGAVGLAAHKVHPRLQPPGEAAVVVELDAEQLPELHLPAVVHIHGVEHPHEVLRGRVLEAVLRRPAPQIVQGPEALAVQVLALEHFLVVGEFPERQDHLRKLVVLRGVRGRRDGPMLGAAVGEGLDTAPRVIGRFGRFGMPPGVLLPAALNLCEAVLLLLPLEHLHRRQQLPLGLGQLLPLVGPLHDLELETLGRLLNIVCVPELCLALAQLELVLRFLQFGLGDLQLRPLGLQQQPRLLELQVEFCLPQLFSLCSLQPPPLLLHCLPGQCGLGLLQVPFGQRLPGLLLLLLELGQRRVELPSLLLHHLTGTLNVGLLLGKRALGRLPLGLLLCKHVLSSQPLPSLLVCLSTGGRSVLFQGPALGFLVLRTLLLDLGLGLVVLLCLLLRLLEGFHQLFLLLLQLLCRSDDVCALLIQGLEGRLGLGKLLLGRGLKRRLLLPKGRQLLLLETKGLAGSLHLTLLKVQAGAGDIELLPLLLQGLPAHFVLPPLADGVALQALEIPLLGLQVFLQGVHFLPLPVHLDAVDALLVGDRLLTLCQLLLQLRQLGLQLRPLSRGGLGPVQGLTRVLGLLLLQLRLQAGDLSPDQVPLGGSGVAVRVRLGPDHSQLGLQLVTLGPRGEGGVAVRVRLGPDQGQLRLQLVALGPQGGDLHAGVGHRRGLGGQVPTEHVHLSPEVRLLCLQHLPLGLEHPLQLRADHTLPRLLRLRLAGVRHLLHQLELTPQLVFAVLGLPELCGDLGQFSCRLRQVRLQSLLATTRLSQLGRRLSQFRLQRHLPVPSRRQFGRRFC